jgi:acyl carrier protein phosphodiesterase
MDGLPELVELRQRFIPPLRRYAGIIIDVAFDHELAKRWKQYSAVSLQQFDKDLRSVLAEYEEILPEELKEFMRYADRRGLFAAYRDKDEILFSLTGLGRRLSRTNPLHQVDKIWDEYEADFARSFEQVFPQVQQAVADWITASKNSNRVAP